MSRMAEQYQQQQELQNLFGCEDQESWEAWLYENEGRFKCPYCDTITDELVLCCGEVHGIEIGV